MARIVIKHLSGSKANQVETFSLDDFNEVTFGRDVSAGVKFHPDRDDLVSRLHAKITRDPTDEGRFLLTDMDSRNGTFLNRQMIRGSVSVVPGDAIQLGAGGPEFEFDLEPRPENLVRPTREIEQPASPVTRETDLRIGTEVRGSQPGPMPSQPPQRTGIGQATVERMIAKRFEGSRKELIYAGTALLAIVAIIVGVLFYMQNTGKAQIEKDLEAQNRQYAAKQNEYQALINRQASELEKLSAAMPMSAKDISSKYGPATVYIEASWKLVDLRTGTQVYHQYTPYQGEAVACFLRVSADSIEPLLTTDTETQKKTPKKTYEKVRNRPVGSEGSLRGSGFVVLSNGFILTNRHVGATWMSVGRELIERVEKGRLCDEEANVLGDDTSITREQLNSLLNWVPGRSKQLGGRVEGRHDRLNVVFPKTNNPIPAKLVRVSTVADVALIKIDVADAMPTVDLAIESEAVANGETIYVLGYPAVSEDPRVGLASADVFNPDTSVGMVPLPTITGGLVGKRVHGEMKLKTSTESVYYSPVGDVYQLTVNATGQGNSGGPVFDSRGRVIGLFTFSRKKEDTLITYAVPIKYGREIMGVKPIL